MEVVGFRNRVAVGMFNVRTLLFTVALRKQLFMPCQPQELRRAVASKAGMESDAREHANRAKRLQREVEMMRSEYEVISEETSSLRGSLAGAEVGSRSGIREGFGVFGTALTPDQYIYALG